jgi:hypothetical protein
MKTKLLALFLKLLLKNPKELYKLLKLSKMGKMNISSLKKKQDNISLMFQDFMETHLSHPQMEV